MTEDCLFCKIAAKKIPAKLIYEDPETLAFYDINPQAPVHVLIIPKRHIARISDLEAKDSLLVGALLFRAKELGRANGWQDYRLVFNTGPEAGQSVYHIHLHLLSGRRFSWPPG